LTTHRIPAIAYVLGVAGAVPFILCGVAASSAGAQALTGLLALLGYGAVILSFVGAVHWGFALTYAMPEPAVPTRRAPSMAVRLALSTVPALIGWAALLLALLSLPQLGLAVLILGFMATIGTEARWNKADLLPPGYMALRVLLSAIVITSLLVVLALRLIGATIIF
jgi:hypothetical protein